MNWISRRDFMRLAGLPVIGSFLNTDSSIAQGTMAMNKEKNFEKGKQRLSLAQLESWEKLAYGMFIHFGMSTFDNDEYSKGDKPASIYHPDKLDVNQWTGVARDAGMKYAVLTAKHVAGHSLWPTKYSDYHSGNSGNKTNVVEAFVNSCRQKGIMPGLYYCSWDNHNLFGSGTPTFLTWATAFTTSEYREFQWNQLEELLTQFGTIGEVWIDIPHFLPRDYRHKLYKQVAIWQPNAIIIFNQGLTDGKELNVNVCWPTDVLTIEKDVPNYDFSKLRWREIEKEKYFVPGEVVDTIGNEWFYKDADQPRSDSELLAIYLLSRARNANLLLNVPPDRSGLIPKKYVDALMRLKRNLDRNR